MNDFLLLNVKGTPSQQNETAVNSLHKTMQLYIGWWERMLDTMEKRTKIYKKHCFGYMKKFIPWRYVLLYLC